MFSLSLSIFVGTLLSPQAKLRSCMDVLSHLCPTRTLRDTLFTYLAFLVPLSSLILIPIYEVLSTCFLSYKHFAPGLVHTAHPKFKRTSVSSNISSSIPLIFKSILPLFIFLLIPVCDLHE